MAWIPLLTPSGKQAIWIPRRKAMASVHYIRWDPGETLNSRRQRWTSMFGIDRLRIQGKRLWDGQDLLATVTAMPSASTFDGAFEGSKIAEKCSSGENESDELDIFQGILPRDVPVLDSAATVTCRTAGAEPSWVVCRKGERELAQGARFGWCDPDTISSGGAMEDYEERGEKTKSRPREYLTQGRVS